MGARRTVSFTTFPISRNTETSNAVRSYGGSGPLTSTEAENTHDTPSVRFRHFRHGSVLATHPGAVEHGKQTGRQIIISKQPYAQQREAYLHECLPVTHLPLSRSQSSKHTRDVLRAFQMTVHSLHSRKIVRAQETLYRIVPPANHVQGHRRPQEPLAHERAAERRLGVVQDAK